MYKGFYKVFSIEFEYVLVSIGIWRSKMQLYLSTRNGASKANIWDRQIPINTGNYSNTMQYACFESFPFRRRLLFSSAKPHDLDGMDFRCQCTKRKLHSISGVLTLLNLKIFFYIFSKRQIKNVSIQLFHLYQKLQCTDNYFFKIRFVLFLYLLLSAS